MRLWLDPSTDAEKRDPFRQAEDSVAVPSGREHLVSQTGGLLDRLLEVTSTLCSSRKTVGSRLTDDFL